MTRPDLAEFQLLDRSSHYRAALLWRLPGLNTLSSAAVNGGINKADWIINIGVEADYRRTDLDTHIDQVAKYHRLEGSGIGLFTAADVSRYRSSNIDGVSVTATVGITKPTWAFDKSGGWNKLPETASYIAEPQTNEIGTINTVIQMPVKLDLAAAVNAVITATEAKTQAIIQAGIAATGTASDAIVITWPDEIGSEEVRFCGCRSYWGSRLAEATYEAISKGISLNRPETAAAKPSEEAAAEHIVMGARE